MPIQTTEAEKTLRNSSRFWDWIAPRYARSPIVDQVSYERKLEVTQGYLRPEMKLLEFGCGTGSTALIHAPRVNHILATDLSAKMLEIAQAKADAANVSNVTFEQTSIEDLAAPEESFDAVLGMSILHLLESKESAIAKVYRLLKPGGLFISSTVCLAETMKFFKFIGPIGHFLGLLPLVRVLSVAELTTSLTDAGFEIDHQWQPGKGKSVFIVAKKPAG